MEVLKIIAQVTVLAVVIFLLASGLDVLVKWMSQNCNVLTFTKIAAPIFGALIIVALKKLWLED